MPDFLIDDLGITPDEFLSKCNRKEIDELINLLDEEGYLPEDYKERVDYDKLCVSEKIFVDYVVGLTNKWTSLSKEDEETIIRIAKKYV